MYLLQVRYISIFVMFDFIYVYRCTFCPILDMKKSAPQEACSLGA